MNPILIHSDRHVIRSDGHSESFFPRAAQTSPPNRARLAPDRTGSAWNIGRNIQALRPAELPLRRRTWTRAQTISVHQPAWNGRPAAQVAQLIGNFRALRTALDEICAINTELLRRREELG